MLGLFRIRDLIRLGYLNFLFSGGWEYLGFGFKIW